MDDWSTFRPDLRIFGVQKNDPGWIYLVGYADLFKIGKTRNPQKRLRDALTWNPDMEVMALKPFWNISRLERQLHEGLADCWHKGEWFRFGDNDARDFVVEGLQGFYEKDRDANSVDFIYWYNGSGMLDFPIERNSRKVSLRRFQRELREERSRSMTSQEKP